MPAKKKKNTQKKTRTHGPKARKKKNIFWRFALKWFIVFGIWSGVIISIILAWYAKDLPSITKNATFDKRPAITVKAQNHKIAARYGELQGNSLSIADMPLHLIHAVLATEDRRFYSHFGIDPIGIARAMVTNLQKGYVSQGGSTITQQLAKNMFLNRERTLKRKIQEAMLALWLEHELNKDQILSAYLNRVYLGSGAYGVDAAAEIYYGTSAKDLNLKEAATLAGLLKAPSKYSPLNNPALAEKRTQTVLRSMVAAQYITQDQANGITTNLEHPTQKPTKASATRYYTDWIVDGLDDLIGPPESDLIVTTTLDLTLQQHAENALIKALYNTPAKNKVTQGAILIMRPDGAVVAMVGGRNYNQSQFNRATQAKRSPGSSFKPFLYLTAFQQGWAPNDLILDAPITQGQYRPKNYHKKYYGKVTLDRALTLSMNTAAIRLMQKTGKDAVAKTARKLGIHTPMNRVNESMALGSVGVSMIEMTTAYASIANGGLKVLPYAITRIENPQGELYYQRRHNKAHQRIIASDHIDNLTQTMQNVIQHGTGRVANPGFPAAGKTGTSQDHRDAWFIGFSNDLIVAVWVGNDDNSPMKDVTGGSIPARIWRDVMIASKGHVAESLKQTHRENTSDTAFGTLLKTWISGKSHKGSSTPTGFLSRNTQHPYHRNNE